MVGSIGVPVQASVGAAVLSVGCELVSTGRSAILKLSSSDHKQLPLGQGGRAAKFEGLTIDQVAFGIEMVVQGGMDGSEFL